MSERVRIALEPLGAVVEVERGAPLADALFRFGVEFPCGGKGRCRGCRVRVLAGAAEAGPEHAALLTPEELAAGWRLACRMRAESDLSLELAQWEMSILGDASAFAFTPAEGFGIAIDLGTTTLVAQIVDLRAGVVVGVETALNPQARWGSDVMSRVQHALDPAGAAELRAAIRESLGPMAVRLAAGRPVERIVLVGNTAMHHLFCGIGVEGLSQAPFETAKPGTRAFTKCELGWDVPGAPDIRFLGCAGGFVGSDVVAGALAVGIGRGELDGLIDLGTNGEIVFGTRGHILCASTAAGPAFEGGRISAGMRAAAGAVAEVWVEDGALACRVLGGGPPRGICGSGLVDAVACGLDLGMVQPGGRGAVPLPGLEVTQRDIREVQLAKAAIAAGAALTLARLGASAGEVGRLHLAGAFGNYVNRASARRIGLVEFPAETVHPAGNTALLGAKMALLSPAFDCAEIEALRLRMEHFALASDAAFEATYVDKMRFDETEAPA